MEMGTRGVKAGAGVGGGGNGELRYCNTLNDKEKMNNNKSLLPSIHEKIKFYR